MTFRPRAVDTSRVEPFQWAWRGRLLIGYLNLLVGDEGVGKGTLLAWLIALMTTGRLPGDLYGKPARVLIVGDEDGFDNVIVPRLTAAGADLSMVLDLPTADNGNLDVKRDTQELKDTIEEYEIKTVFFDQFLDNLGADVDPWKDSQVRAAMTPIRRMAAEAEICPILSLHTNKSHATTFRQRVSGTQAFNALSRSSLLLAEHPDDPDRRILIRGKGNYSAPPPALEFSIDTQPLTINGHVHEPTRVIGMATSQVRLDEVLGAQDRQTSKAAQARDVIADTLADGDWHDAAPIRAELAEAGLSDRGIVRAGNDLGIERRRTNGFPSRNEWRLARGGELTVTTGTTGTTEGASSATGATGASTASHARLTVVTATPGDEARITALEARHAEALA